MRKNGAFNPNKQAIYAAKLDASQHLILSRRKKLCWKCQKSKSTTGGHLVLKPGLHMFVCKDCLEAKKEQA